MSLADEIRDCPASWALAASWVLVFLALHLVQWRSSIVMPPAGIANPLAISSQVGHRFGDLTWSEIRQGEVWRLVTATFIHFSLVHIAMNAFGLIKLGQLIEPWYGPGPFLAVCVAIGGLGNLAGGLLRQAGTSSRTWLVGSRVAQAWPAWFRTGGPDGIEGSFNTPSGGGSTILLGLLGLAAVVGWRSKTRIGSFLRDQMVTMLGFTAVLGFVLVNLIDNYGHAGGALIGAGFGFIHRPLLRISERSRTFRVLCWAMVATVLIGSGIAAVRDDRFESRYRSDFAEASARHKGDFAALEDLQRISILYVRLLGLAIELGQWRNDLDLIAIDPLIRQLARTPLPTTPTPLTLSQWRVRTSDELRAALDAFDSRPTASWGSAVELDLATIKALGRDALDQPPTYRQLYAFTVAWRSARKAISLDLDQTRSSLIQLGRQRP